MDHDLSGLLGNPSVKFTEPQIKCYMLQLLEGTKYLHEVRVWRLLVISPWRLLKLVPSLEPYPPPGYESRQFADRQ